MLQRHLTGPILAALADTPVVLINGPRQAGKSTLVQWIARQHHPAQYVTLDDAAVLTAATRDPVAFAQAFDGPAIIDEVQRVPVLFRALKTIVDRNRRPGQFLLTGSANVLMVPRISESLAGRIEILTLRPFSAGELEGRWDEFVDAVFAEPFAARTPSPVARAELLRRVTQGGFPEMLRRATAERRRAWFGAYVTTVLQRDIRELAQIEGLTEMPRLLELIAAQAAALLNVASLSRDTTLSQPTLKRYLRLLEATFLVDPLRPWSGNVAKRLIKTPKLFLADTGLMAYLLGVPAEPSGATVGPLLESFVAQELRKQISWSRTQPRLFYYRTAAGRQVDFVLEDARGRVVGIEVKAGATVGRHDLKGLEDFAQARGGRFVRGVLLYTGEQGVSFASNLHALPISALWRTGPTGGRGQRQSRRETT